MVLEHWDSGASSSYTYSGKLIHDKSTYIIRFHMKEEGKTNQLIHPFFSVLPSNCPISGCLPTHQLTSLLGNIGTYQSEPSYPSHMV
jgi:hypothetical protein